MPEISHFSEREAARLFKVAKRVLQQPTLDILLAPHKQQEGRILVVTAKKVGNAPERNTVRRRLRSIFYEEKLFEKGHDCIVIIKKGGVSLSFEQLRDLLLEAFEQVAPE